MASVLDLVRAYVPLTQIEEWTCEVNPGTLTRPMAELLRRAGVNRLSIGAQSFTDVTLQKLGRIHRAGETRDCVAMQRARRGLKTLGWTRCAHPRRGGG